MVPGIRGQERIVGIWVLVARMPGGFCESVKWVCECSSFLVKMSASFHSVPVVDVSAENLEQVWPCLLRWIKETSFVAIDTVS